MNTLCSSGPGAACGWPRALNGFLVFRETVVGLPWFVARLVLHFECLSHRNIFWLVPAERFLWRTARIVKWIECHQYVLAQWLWCVLSRTRYMRKHNILYGRFRPIILFARSTTDCSLGNISFWAGLFHHHKCQPADLDCCQWKVKEMNTFCRAQVSHIHWMRIGTRRTRTSRRTVIHVSASARLTTEWRSIKLNFYTCHCVVSI